MSEVDWQELLGWGDPQLKDLRMMGYDYLRQGSYERAIALFEGLIVFRDALPYDHQTLGALYLEVGRYEEAVKRLDIALHFDPDHPSTQLNKAKALCFNGQHHEGVALALRLAVHRDPEIARLASALAMAYSD